MSTLQMMLHREAGLRSCCSLLKHKETQRSVQISSAVGSASPAWNERPLAFATRLRHTADACKQL
jgi:hypothetical protein